MTNQHSTGVVAHVRSLTRGILGYGGYVVGNIVFVIAIMPLFALLFFAGRTRGRFMRAVFRSYLAFLTQRYLPFLGVYRFREISGRDRLPATPAVYAANHRSRIDALVLLALLPGAATVIKSTYARMPVFSSFVKHLDFVSVDDGSLESMGRALERCRTLVTAGKSILVFPEGTRATTGRLQPFKDLAFRIAAEAQVPVVPVVIHSDLPFMAKRPKSLIPARRFDFTVRFLAPEQCATSQRVAETSDRVRRIMARELDGLDKGTVWES